MLCFLVNTIQGQLGVPGALRGDPATPTCKTAACYSNVLLSPPYSLQPSYNSIDLREAGLVTAAQDEGECANGAWAFAMVDLESNLLLRSQWMLRLTSATDKWMAGSDDPNAELSPQYYLSNQWSPQMYCDGGDVQIGFSWKMESHPAMELSADTQLDISGKKNDWDSSTPLGSATTDAINVVDTFPNAAKVDGDGRTTTTPNLAIFQPTTDQPAATVANGGIPRAMQHLSRGLAVSASIAYEATSTFLNFDQLAAPALITKDNADLAVACTPTMVQSYPVTIVGYGKKGGKNVWIVKTSRGEAWGQKGFFYIERESNLYCIERSFYGLLPVNYDGELAGRGDLSKRALGNGDTLDPEIAVCPSSKPYYIYESNLLTCLAKCPDSAKFAEQDGYCRPMCTMATATEIDAPQRFSCVLKCPNFSTNHTEVLKCADGVACPSNFPNLLTKFSICNSACTKYISSAGVCIDSYGSEFYESQLLPAACVPGCAKKTNAGFCSDYCPSEAFNDGPPKSCVSGCSKMYDLDAYGQKRCLDSCPTGQYNYNGQCVVACPNAAPFVATDGTSPSCSTSCPSTDAYEIDDKGHKNCIVLGASDTIQSRCKFWVADASFVGVKQCFNNCPPSVPFADTARQCISTCSFYIADGSGAMRCVPTCVKEATNKYFVGSAGPAECLAKCPDNKPYIESTNECVARCSSGKYIEGFYCSYYDCPTRFLRNATNDYSLKCIDTCQTPYDVCLDGKECRPACSGVQRFSIDTKCVQACPDNIYQIEDSVVFKCLPSCGTFTLASTEYVGHDECLAQCPEGKQFYLDNNCMEKCGSGEPYYVRTSNGFQCTAACSGGTSKHVSGEFECLAVCPFYAPYENGQECVATCPSQYYQGTQCVPASSFRIQDVAKAMYLSVSNCGTMGDVGGVCKIDATTCASGFFELDADFKRTCLQACQLFFVTIKEGATTMKLCVDTCPSGFPYISGSECISTVVFYYRRGSSQLSVASCSDVPQLPVASGKQCVESCPQNTPFDLSSQCRSSCPSLRYVESGLRKTCVDSCSALSVEKVFDSGTHMQCVSQCPSTLPEDINGVCKNLCGGFFAEYPSIPLSCYDMNYLNSSKTCLDNNQSFYEIRSKERYCKTSCALYIKTTNTYGLGECTDSCNTSYPFQDGIRCRESCAVYYSQGTKYFCVSSCSQASGHLYSYVYPSGTIECMAACPVSRPFVVEGQTTCLTDCSSEYYYLNVGSISWCVRTCPFYRKGRECTSSCVGYSTEGQCMNSCPDGYLVTPELSCVTACPQGSVQYQKSCMSSCPSGTRTRKSSGVCEKTTFMDNGGAAAIACASVGGAALVVVIGLAVAVKVVAAKTAAAGAAAAAKSVVQHANGLVLTQKTPGTGRI